MSVNNPFIFFFLFACSAARGQDWLATPIPPSARYDDVFFISDSLGWAAGGDGKIYHTRNGGNSWQLQFTAGAYLRSIEFVSPFTGYCGSLDTALYKTTDGGNTWTDISININPKPAGICGLAAPDSLHIYGCGIWNSPAFIVKSSDGGKTWTYKDMSAFASGLVDIFFLNKDTGFAVGSSKASGDGGIVLYTTNGGTTWEVKYKTMVAEDIVWKIQTPDSIYFFGSVYSLPVTKARMIRSVNRGLNWTSVDVKQTYQPLEMIGFIDRTTGWTGGSQSLFKTTDGGQTWSENLFQGTRWFNRFFRVSGNLAYLSGNVIYQYKINAPPPVDPGSTTTHRIVVVPNPARGRTRIEIQFITNTFANLSLYTSDGKKLGTLLNEHVPAGKKIIPLDLHQYPSATYYLVLKTNEGMIHTMLVNRW